jgi:ABC-type antimicrobial peptide transport system permease subunit
MIRNFLIITFRNMMKNKLFIIINVLGMAIAIGCCIVGYFAYEYDANFDAIHKNREQIYRVSANRTFNNQIEKLGYVPTPLTGIIQQNIKDVDKSTRFHFSWSNLKRENDLFESRLAYIDPDFFEMFTFDFLTGNPSEIKDKTTVFISDKMAIRLFGSPTEAMGKQITQVYGTSLKELKVGGVFREPPQNSSFYYREAYINFDNHKDEFTDHKEDDWKRDLTMFVQINNPERVAGVEKQLQAHVESNNRVREDHIIKDFVLDHFPTMAFRDRDAEVRNWTWEAPPQSAIIGSGVMGILILLIACFNLTNTAMAISSKRLKEIGIRKVMGSMRNQLVTQFLSETLLICFIALIFGLFFADWLVQGWNSLWEFMRLTPHYLDNPKFVFFMIAVLVFTGIVAGAYPAFYISRFEPINILKGKLKFGGSNFLSWFLLGAQFSISLIAIVSAIAFWQNARYQQNYDLGFNIKGSVIAWLNDKDEVEAYRNALAGNPKIQSMAGANSGIFSNRSNDPVEVDSKQVKTDVISVGDNYLKTMNLKLKEGRDFIPDSETDKKESVIISQKLADKLGWEKPLGKELLYQDSVRLYVVGVVKDVYTMGLWRELEPMMIRYIGRDQYSQIVVSGNANDVSEIHKFMEAKWKELFPYRLYNGRMLSMDFQEVSDVNNNILKMFAFLGIIAMMLSATGLFTLISLNIIKRMKEIGVRKVLGASIANITRIINTEFFVILVVASLLGSAASYFAVDALMGSIWKYYQASNALTFVLSIMLMFIISAVAIGYKVFSAASMNPVNTLRNE